jgi:hypothetical protein
MLRACKQSQLSKIRRWSAEIRKATAAVCRTRMHLLGRGRYHSEGGTCIDNSRNVNSAVKTRCEVLVLSGGKALNTRQKAWATFSSPYRRRSAPRCGLAPLHPKSATKYRTPKAHSRSSSERATQKQQQLPATFSNIVRLRRLDVRLRRLDVRLPGVFRLKSASAAWSDVLPQVSPQPRSRSHAAASAQLPKSP